MASLGDLLTSAGESGKQLFLWGTLAEIVRAATAPYLRELEYLVNTKHPNVPLSPADLAQAVVRGVMNKATADKIARKSGADTAQMKVLYDLAAGPPGIETVLQMYRRGIVEWGKVGPTQSSVANAIATSRIYTYWSDALKAMNILPIPAAEMVDAIVEGQTTRGTRSNIEAAARGEQVSGLTPAATTFYEVMWANGYTPDQADLMFNTRGNPPAPTQLIELYRRGLIQWTGTGPLETTVQQGIYEGATKDKWEPLYKGLVVNIPSEYYLLTMMKTGQIPITVGAKLLHMYGYTQTVVAGIIGVASSESVATEKKLTKSIIEDLFLEDIFNATEAMTYLEGIGLGHEAATFTVTAWEMTLSKKQTDAAITKTRTLFIDRKIDAAEARSALEAYGITTKAATTVLTTWTLERAQNVTLLTSSEVTDLVKYAITGSTGTTFGISTGLTYLQALGYSPRDAWLRLASALHGTTGFPPIPPAGQSISGTVL